MYFETAWFFLFLMFGVGELNAEELQKIVPVLITTRILSTLWHGYTNSSLA